MKNESLLLLMLTAAALALAGQASASIGLEASVCRLTTLSRPHALARVPSPWEPALAPAPETAGGSGSGTAPRDPETGLDAVRSAVRMNLPERAPQ